MAKAKKAKAATKKATTQKAAPKSKVVDIKKDVPPVEEESQDEQVLGLDAKTEKVIERTESLSVEEKAEQVIQEVAQQEDESKPEEAKPEEGEQQVTPAAPKKDNRFKGM